jgi:hypothetical protein
MQQVKINPPAERYKFTDVSVEGNAPTFMVKSKPNKKPMRSKQCSWLTLIAVCFLLDASTVKMEAIRSLETSINF